MKIEVESNLSDGMQETLDAVLARSKDILPYFEIQASMLDGLIQADSFGEATSPFGDAWKPLAQSTIDARRKGKGKGSPSPLIDTWALRKGTFAKGYKGWIEFGVSGAGAVYAAAHQFGVKTNQGRDRPPARPFLPASNGQADFSRGPAKEWYDDMVSGLAEWLTNGSTHG